MEISDEMIGCYVEGILTEEERTFVQEYLRMHPEEYEHVLCLMDNYKIDYLDEQLDIVDSCTSSEETSFYDIAYSAAAFAPQRKKLFKVKGESNSLKVNGLYDRLTRMSNELDEI